MYHPEPTNEERDEALVAEADDQHQQDEHEHEGSRAYWLRMARESGKTIGGKVQTEKLAF